VANDERPRSDVQLDSSSQQYASGTVQTSGSLGADCRAAHGERAGALTGSTQFGGDCPALRSVLDVAARIAPTRLTALIVGESGTGKELLARLIHERSPRAAKPFVVVNCSAIPRELVESEMFGSEKGAFTGAIAGRKGKFEQADGGTLFLDEIGDLPLEQQPKFLRALQQGEIQRVGGQAPKRVDIRVVAATNRDLLSMVKAGTFREDLYYRLREVRLLSPPLRDRGSDIQLLAEAVLVKDGIKRAITPEAKRVLQRYRWPGNIRELESVIRVAALMGDGERITPADLERQMEEPVPAEELRDVPPPTFVGRNRERATERQAPIANRRRRGRPGATRESQFAAVLELAARHGRVTQAQVRAALKVGPRRAKQILMAMKERGMIASRDRGRRTYYVAPESKAIGNTVIG
jgi:transcriptional regulator with GAF, ATPase, and Fis domain